MPSITALHDLNRDIDRLDPAIIEQAAGFPSSVLADVAGRRGGMHSRISALSPSMHFAGSAITVDVRAGDNLMIHAALAIAKAGDVLVIDGKADLTCSLMGQIMCETCCAVGIAAVVIDGAVRDSEEIREMGFPVFAAGFNPNGPTKLAPGRINHPVSVGGVTVHPGDLIVGDADGVTVIERAKAAAMMPLAAAKIAAESDRIARIKTLQTMRPAWLDGALRSAGVLKADETI